MSYRINVQYLIRVVFCRRIILSKRNMKLHLILLIVAPLLATLVTIVTGAEETPSPSASASESPIATASVSATASESPSAMPSEPSSSRTPTPSPSPSGTPFKVITPISTQVAFASTIVLLGSTFLLRSL